ncbi:hypothetical protein OU798_10175 [Prolixibacteraceae bacterium Z1-6]|uniref:Uncharacterized protein n=1 Tax=Draconibacterium aestuarii TaxID=2998507 RepID=A0A9X3F501_9BACT|nr:hypothetical protein [Prolixibacteraceae bacterium Z1-6]
MEEEKRNTPQSEPAKEKDGNWIDKAEAKIDETAEKIHQSKAYRNADKKLEETTKKLFRKAGRWWGKL